SSEELKVKPAPGRKTTTIDHSCHTTKPRNSQAMDQARLRLAMARPPPFHCAVSSASHPCSHRPRVPVIAAPAASADADVVPVAVLPVRSALISNLPVAPLMNQHYERSISGPVTRCDIAVTFPSPPCGWIVRCPFRHPPRPHVETIVQYVDTAA